MDRVVFIGLLVAGLLWMGRLYLDKEAHRRLHDPQYHIVAIVQTHETSDRLNSGYLAECLDLSCDRPENLYAFDLEKAHLRLLASPLIASVKIKKIPPGTLHILYRMRQPIAYVGDVTNTAVDREGVLFPVSPFYAPKKIPHIFLGLPFTELSWGKSVRETPVFQKALAVLTEGTGQELEVVDCSRMGEKTLGGRELVLRNQEGMFLRIYPDEIVEGFRKWGDFCRAFPEKSLGVLDLRFRKMGLFYERVGGDTLERREHRRSAPDCSASRAGPIGGLRTSHSLD